jgi:hypothetical protein
MIGGNHWINFDNKNPYMVIAMSMNMQILMEIQPSMYSFATSK